MVKIRLKKFGAPKRPYYRIVAVDSRKPRDGKTLEELGFYRPVESDQFKVDQERVQYWIKNGAQATDTVRDLFRKYKIALN
ncbi:30S ribosomal protein S16 [Entomospira culicis]|uniref:Small ribosomal subunit protein bS16 n=1 Tax=Entomospira culicis TaxID=2719989 RepID=A0A968GEW0_9SPIO|nr:30S ribosomal protein S16 [Entomospira culicis]NIZ19013.1 30S ribosomal protein S16 [Entomospira culicis]NIZ69228.1 30S ribosomal protein S16 [Entomospira culicis]WDI37812.1 30S ribosomal protein S16 [Entomospira culicis]WDI39440.1 30S ribosomal protein S16 [Entomospira culicis]